MFSIITLIILSAVLLSANGSFELVGFSLTPKKPTKVSILSVTDKAKLKGLVRALKEIVDELEAEIYSDPDAYTGSEFSSPSVDYDEVFEDDDG